ncbi:MAG: carboxypeptidase M32 [Spirochaetaceae bacterium]|nr:carboxypeptidase M32 [Spirochaetaceae bacterium]MDT8297751.1 carboxypeptidase M32 [Spirochaetaceae bacterium]
MNDITAAIAGLKELDETVTRLGHVAALLEWDQETYLPEKAIEERSNQVAMIMGLHHEKVVDPSWESLFVELGYDGGGGPDGVDEIDNAFLRESYKRWKKKAKVPKRLVEEMARVTSISQAAWASARKADDFTAFAPHLRKVLDLEKEYALIVNPDADPYDTLLDEYEPGAKGDEIADLFDGLAAGLDDLLRKIQSGNRPPSSFLEKPYSVAKQNEFGKIVQQYMGYDTHRGRLDLSTHPFTTTLGPDDVRVTTRYDENLVLSGLFSNIHEAGHGLYEQGVGRSLRGTILADGTSLGIHESQSRFWENVVGRSRPFWNKWYPEFSRLFAENLETVDVGTFYRAVNQVRPSLIRVEADEVTYSFHIIIRFRLERALLAGDLTVEDLPEAWRESYRDLLGITPSNDADGCLQDVHWSVGLIGYFPTYALGNLYAAQFTRAMENELGPLGDLVADDRIGKVLGWLRKNIHSHGRVYLPGELCRRVTGAELDPGYFLDYLNAKYSEVYQPS